MEANVVLTNNYTLNIRWDYLLHFIVYMPLPILLYFRFIQAQRSGAVVKVIIMSLLISPLLELLQLVLPFRSFNINDLYANMGGVVLGLIVILVFRRRFLRNSGSRISPA